jgi:Protein of unknown function (DUF669)
MARLSFNADKVDPKSDFDPIPAGKYLAIITESEVKPTKAGTGSYLQLKFQILEGEFKDRLVWARLNLENPNPKAVQIAEAELSTLCRAIGVMSFQDSAALHNLPVVIKVKCKQRPDSDEYSNEIKGYFKRETPSTFPQPAAVSTPPWKRPAATESVN